MFYVLVVAVGLVAAYWLLRRPTTTKVEAGTPASTTNQNQPAQTDGPGNQPTGAGVWLNRLILGGVVLVLLVCGTAIGLLIFGDFDHKMIAVVILAMTVFGGIIAVGVVNGKPDGAILAASVTGAVFFVPTLVAIIYFVSMLLAFQDDMYTKMEEHRLALLAAMPEASDIFVWMGDLSGRQIGAVMLVLLGFILITKRR